MTDKLDDLFHCCSFVAYVTVAREQQGWPDSESVRRLAYRLYEEALAERNTAKQPATPPPA